MTEEEQLAAIKSWWNKYSTLITISVSIVLVIISGYRYWDWRNNKIINHASNSYEHLMIAFSEQNTKAVQSYANQLINDYPKTVYADVARLSLAKVYVDDSNYDKALRVLKPVAENSAQFALKEIAHLRVARLLISKKQYEKASTELDLVTHCAYVSVANELKGDIFRANHNYKSALEFYNKAELQNKAQGITNLYLEMKQQAVTALNLS